MPHRRLNLSVNLSLQIVSFTPTAIIEALNQSDTFSD